MNYELRIMKYLLPLHTNFFKYNEKIIYYHIIGSIDYFARPRRFEGERPASNAADTAY